MRDPLPPAIVLAAGLGSRLAPLTRTRAKPAVPVAGTPLILRVLAWLGREGVRDVVLTLHHRPEYALYDLKNDPHELTNLADDPKRKETVSRLRNTLFTWLEKRGDADPIATERKITQNKGAKPKNKGGKNK